MSSQSEGIMIDTSNHEILSEREVSRWLGVSEPTLFRHRRDGTGPKFIQLSERRIGYRRSAIEGWLQERERQMLGPKSSTRSADVSGHKA
jgi:predicted DNA-binding transcriptional regulator AlpA